MSMKFISNIQPNQGYKIMTAIAYKLNPDQARETDQGNSRIQKTGDYVGIFTVAKHITANSGAIGIEFNFHSEDGQEASYLTLYTRNANGEPIYGEKQLYALMTCIKAREIKPEEGTINEFDFSSKSIVTKQATIYKDLMGKKIGVVLQSEEYKKNNGDIGTRMILVRFFDAETRKTASEILDKTPPVILENYLSTLKDKKLSQVIPSHPSTSSNLTDDLMIDDIPF